MCTKLHSFLIFENGQKRPFFDISRPDQNQEIDFPISFHPTEQAIF